MNKDVVDKGIAGYEKHLLKLARVFNEYAKTRGLSVMIDPTSVIASVKSGVGLASVSSFWTRGDDNGIVHEEQIKTAIDCMHNLQVDPKQCGHVVGAMQSGKTTTSLALQWAGPITYMLTGQPVYPFYIIGNQTNHEDQTKLELGLFLSYYGDLEIRPIPNPGSSTPSVDAMFERSPSLNTYRRHMLRGAFEDTLDVPRLEDLVHRRVGGVQSLKQIADLCQRATKEKYRPLMIIDEPQFGASDRIVVEEDGIAERKCVLTQIFDRIEQELGSTRSDHWFIGLSATPFELNDLERVWEVRQSLKDSYSGFNYFNGRPISEGSNIKSPITMSLSKFAQSIKVPFLAHVVMAAYDLSKPKAFASHSKKMGYTDDQASYRRATETALREAIYKLLDRYKKDERWPVGFCVRAFNDNTKTEALIGGLALDPKLVEVIKYYGHAVSSVSVKRAIARRTHKDLPYVIFVTNRARMADSFPPEVRFFIDFGQKASDLNSLLQGLLGRACGYNKESTVVLSDLSNDIVDAYIATKGAYVYRTSRHSIPVGGYRRGAPTGMIKLRVEMDDPIVKKFFRKMNSEVVAKNIPAGSTTLNPHRAKKSEEARRGPILRIAEELGLFDHIEDPTVRAAIFPQIPTAFRVARQNDAVRRNNQSDDPLRYSLDEEGNCRYTFRWSERDAGARGGAPGRAKGKRDVGQHMEPTVYVEKFDPKNGEIINDRRAPEERTPGNWGAFMVTFPLLEPIRELQAAEVAYPISRSPYSGWMAPEELIRRDAEEQRRAEDSSS